MTAPAPLSDGAEALRLLSPGAGVQYTASESGLPWDAFVHDFLPTFALAAGLMAAIWLACAVTAAAGVYLGGFVFLGARALIRTCIRWIRDHDPDGWRDAVAFDIDIRHGHPRAGAHGQPLRGQYFLHHSCRPLDQVDLAPPSRGSLRLARADAAEDGDPDGCSPSSCRSGTPIADVRRRQVARSEGAA